VIIAINLLARSVTLTEPDDFERFSAVVVGAGTADALSSVLRQSRLGRIHPDGAHVVVDPAALRAMAGDTATPEWEEGFEAMQTYAAGKGWVEEDGGILAHIERRG
jgi:hypothetical protein